jgi:hypothetical protein
MAHARSEISLREKSAQKNRWQDRPDSHNNTGLYTSTDATRRARTFCKRLKSQTISPMVNRGLFQYVFQLQYLDVLFWMVV